MLKYVIILILCLSSVVGFGYALRYIYKNRKKSKTVNNQQITSIDFKTYDRQSENEISKVKIQLLQNQLNETQRSVEKNDFSPPLLDQHKSSQPKSRIQVRKAELPDDIAFEDVNVSENQSLKAKMKAKHLAMKTKSS